MTLRNRWTHGRGPRTGRAPGVLALSAFLLTLLSSCSSLDFERETATSGTFEATGWAFTIFSIDLPKSALDIARENVSDARQPNVEVTYAKVWPYFGWFDWVFEFIGFRRARIAGTWGFAPDASSSPTSGQSIPGS